VHRVRRRSGDGASAAGTLARTRTHPLSPPPTTKQIDLDTIETSNLNRQFLFRRAHVSQPKAEVAAAAVRAFAPPSSSPSSIRGERANVKEPRFNVDFLRAFDVVLNGLDNAEARRHVNRLCLAAGVPLVESGTAGYLGQVTVHVRGVSQCYECVPKPSQAKTYPVCTLRNTPDKPIHCVVWAKDLLFAQLFGGPGAVTDLDGDAGGAGGGEGQAGQAGGWGAEAGQADGATTGSDKAAANGEGDKEAAGEDSTETEAAAAAAAAAKQKKAREEAAAEAAARASAFARRDGEPALAYAARVFEHEYGAVVRRLAANTSLWARSSARGGGKGGGAAAAAAQAGRAKPPVPLSLVGLLGLPAAAAVNGGSNGADAATTTTTSLFPEALDALATLLALPDPSAPPAAPPAPPAAAEDDGAAPTTITTPKTRSAARAVGLSDDHRVWTTAENARVFLRSAVALLTERPSGITEAFDKDDDLAVDFVVSAANLRAACFSIAPQTRFAAKGMAGNIVHAIATTNAAVAGIVVSEATKLLAGLGAQACHSTFLNEADRRTGRARAPLRVLLARAALEPPSASCMACGRAVVTLRADTSRLTLRQLVEAVLKRHLALNEPTLASDGGFMYEEGEGLEDDEKEANERLLPLALAALPGGGVKGGSVLSVTDQSQGGTRVELVVRHDAGLDELEAPEGFLLEGAAAAVQAAAAAAAAGGGGDGREQQQEEQAQAKKRAREDKEQVPPPQEEVEKQDGAAKRPRSAAAAEAAAAPVELGDGDGEDDDGDAVVLSSD
jgi:ubiquitin-like 1-activating enzyme E1 B